MSDAKRELYRNTLRKFLGIWGNDLAYFKGRQGLARMLIESCSADCEEGMVDPLPWLVLADLIEEGGARTSIRAYAMAIFSPNEHTAEGSFLRRLP